MEDDILFGDVEAKTKVLMDKIEVNVHEKIRKQERTYVWNVLFEMPRHNLFPSHYTWVIRVLAKDFDDCMTKVHKYINEDWYLHAPVKDSPKPLILKVEEMFWLEIE